ncbi:MAG: translation initiation factor IF-2 [bacterium]|nr:translation initiation factor IF-2 [bacterium]MCM1374963.1 translation initiation factor IF-2 [Muribaculum sp.]
MAKMKVHELAKEVNKQSKEILAFLQEKGIEAKAANSSVEEENVELVRKAFGRKEDTKVETREKPSEESIEEKPTQNKAPAAPKKKKTIIFLNNSQNSKMPSQKGRGNGQQQGQGRQGQNSRGGSNNGGTGGRPAARMPIKPLTPPSPTPSVQMVPSKPQPRKQPKEEAVVESAPQQAPVVERPQQQEKGAAVRPQQGGPAREQNRAYDNKENKNFDRGADRNQDRAVRRDGSYQGNRDGQRGDGFQGTNQAGQGSRDGQRGGGYQGGRDGQRGSGYQGGRDGQRGGSYQGGRDGQRNGGFQGNRQGGQTSGGQFGGRGSASGGRPAFGKDSGGGRSFGGGRPGQGDKFRGQQQGGKGFGGEAPGKDSEKHREEEKRRISQEKDKRSRKDYMYEDEGAMKNKPGRFIKPEKKKEESAEEAIKVIVLPEAVTIKELADKMKLQPSVIVKKLFLEGKIVTVNQEISYEDAESIAMEYEILCEREVKVDVIEELLKEDEEAEENLVERPPVICVMGHVDHGKTSLLDAIRRTNVTDKEAGGITQHIGAYTVSVGERKITFLDTPGHEAFTAMRMRGANATDIAVLVVAADDGVMPQTIEAINHAKAAGIEIVVAVNKIDKPAANIERVKQELTEHELISVDWGGNTEFVPVSAKTGEGINNLLETILLTADILELKANPDRRARGLVIEAELDKGRGPVATVLVQKGRLQVGDFISAGSSHGKVRAMIDDKGRRVKEALPSTPVEILGLSDVPSAGEVFIAHDSDKTAKNYAETYLAQNKEKMIEETKSRMSLDDLFSQIKEGNLKELNLIVKADVQGSVEAVKQSLMKLTNEEIVVKCIHGGVGAINESDVSLASASNAIIIGFNVRPDATAKATAEREGVDIRLYKVIYQVIEDIEAAMKGMLDPVFEEKVIGHAEVRQIFKASAVGNIAGSYVLDGIFQRGCKIRITREGDQIYEGSLASLKRFKDDVKEVKAGFECGLVFEGFDQMQELDIVEAYIMVEVPRV